MRVLLSVVLLIIFSSCRTVYHTGGYVLDMFTEKPIKDVTVYNSGKHSFKTKTDTFGYYSHISNKRFIAPKVSATFIKDGYDTSLIKDIFDYSYLELIRINTDSIYYKVEKMPDYIGGEKAMNEFMVQKFIYPAQEDKNWSLKASMIIDSLGRIQSPQIISPLHKNRLTPAENEFLKIISEMPAWSPGITKNKKVNVMVKVIFYPAITPPLTNPPLPPSIEIVKP